MTEREQLAILEAESLGGQATEAMANPFALGYLPSANPNEPYRQPSDVPFPTPQYRELYERSRRSGPYGPVPPENKNRFFDLLNREKVAEGRSWRGRRIPPHFYTP